MARLKHANVVALRGVCSLDEPLCVVLEYVRCGDLASFLRSSSSSSTAGAPVATAATNAKLVRPTLR